MKTLREKIAFFTVLFVIAVVASCEKEDNVIRIPYDSTLESLKAAYSVANAYNDSLMVCTNDSSWHHHDSLGWHGMIHYYDRMYHHYDSSFCTYNAVCQQQIQSCWGGSSMSGGMNGNNGMMGGNGGTMGGNYNAYMTCVGQWNTLTQCHMAYHPGS